MITYQFNEELQILEVTYLGAIKFNDLIEFGNNVYKDETLPRKLKILTDATNARYNIKHSDLKILINSLKEHVSVYESVKAAFIQDQPKETAFSLIVEMNAKIPNYYHAVFSTREAAFSWLLYHKK
ncbi:MAG: hypothetical protein R6V23_15575 [Bacteroidales bacterium]